MKKQLLLGALLSAGMLFNIQSATLEKYTAKIISAANAQYEAQCTGQ